MNDTLVIKEEAMLMSKLDVGAIGAVYDPEEFPVDNSEDDKKGKSKNESIVRILNVEAYAPYGDRYFGPGEKLGSQKVIIFLCNSKEE